MEVRINKNLSECKENAVMGLSLKQAILCGVGCLIGGGAFFFLQKIGLSQDMCSILTMLLVAPFAAMAFVHYNGLDFIGLAKALLKQYWLVPKHIPGKTENVLYEKDRAKIISAEKKEAHRND